MFRGEYQHALDAKGRVIIPARLREGLGVEVVLTRGLERAIFVFPNSVWTRLEQQLTELAIGEEEPRAFNRIIFSGAVDAEFDRQGRVLIPQNLREHAGIEKDVVIIGAGERVEIWSKPLWNEYYNSVFPNYEELARHTLKKPEPQNGV